MTIKENYFSTPYFICGKSVKQQQSRTQDHYRSVGRTLTVSFIFSTSYDYAFLLEFASVSKFLFKRVLKYITLHFNFDFLFNLVNTRLISGRSGDQGSISSPHFPTVYPQDYSNEIKLQNLDFVNSSTYGGSIMLIFDDFSLGLSSFIEVCYSRIIS